MIPYTPPTFQSTAFNCPNCSAFAKQSWETLRYLTQVLPELKISRCHHCNCYTLWRNERILYPDVSGIPNPNVDLREDIKEDYMEARAIFNRSPRGATALLRLGVQKLCKQLGEKGENINSDIANLVKKGLPVQVQQALDVVRVVGNNAVHPGQIDLKDDPETAQQLFAFLNIIADVMISQPKRIKEQFDALPKNAIDAIQKRDRTP